MTNAMRTSPGADWTELVDETFSYPVSLAIAVRSSTLVLRLITRGRGRLPSDALDVVALPGGFAIDAEPPLPHENTAASLM